MHLAFKGDSVAVAAPQISKLPRNHRQCEHIPVNRTRYPIFISFHSLPRSISFSLLIQNTRLPVRDPRFLHFLLLPLTWKHNDRFSSKRNRGHVSPSPYLSRRSAKKSRLWPPHGSSALLRNTSPWSRVSRTVFPDGTEILRRPAGSGLRPCSNRPEKRKERLRSSKIIAHLADYIRIINFFFFVVCNIKFNNACMIIFEWMHIRNFLIRCLIRIIKYRL